ncbi:Hypothetical predicted protein [Olea europaea subsp. europaea]|uniref:Uncharacterized protein n=1 Tax=Olea europaea subsp. europaea TaxID=158383 RepID=A0A8S0SGV1_OLEEU|nr:Hypothetical predicted protein [Olea europaea subsp. europaea]
MPWTTGYELRKKINVALDFMVRTASDGFAIMRKLIFFIGSWLSNLLWWGKNAYSFYSKLRLCVNGVVGGADLWREAGCVVPTEPLVAGAGSVEVWWLGYFGL